MHEQLSDRDRGRDPEASAAPNGDGTAGDYAEDPLIKDQVFEVLYNRRRRRVIAYLRNNGGTATVGDLAECIAAEENDTTEQRLSSYERKRVYVGLYQNHLPKMDDVGVVEYDKDRGTVRLRERATQLEPYLEASVGSDSSHLNVVGTAVLAGFLLLGIADVGLLGAGSSLLWTALGVIGFLGISAYDEYGLSSA